MAIANVTLLNTFDEWRNTTNQLVAFTEQSNTILYRVQTTANLGYAAANAASSNASNVGLAANAYTNSVALASNSWANIVGISANSWANVIGTYANSYADAVGAGGNAYTVVVGAASNGWANAIGTGGNSYARAVGTAGNSYTVAVGAGGNSYTVQVGAAANGWANTQSVTDRLIANNAAIAANNYAAATYATKGQTMYVGTTALAINRTSAALNLSGVTLFGNANTATLAGTRGTAVSLSGQTVVQWTGIPSGARKIIMGVYGAASGPSAIPQVQVGTGGTYVSSGYTGCTQKTGSVSGLYPTSCIDLDDYGNQYSYYGNLTFTNITGNMWVWSGVFGTLTSGGVGALVATTGGSVTLSGVLDSLQIFNSTGATFTAGTVNIIYY